MCKSHEDAVRTIPDFRDFVDMNAEYTTLPPVSKFMAFKNLSLYMKHFKEILTFLTNIKSKFELMRRGGQSISSC